jgi:hypothetical protein
MSPGSHASPDGSFGRSAGIQVGRAAILLVVATLIGLALLHRGSGGGRGGGLAVDGGNTTATSAATIPTTQFSPPGSSNTTGTQALRAKADIKVIVANGTGTSGLASTVSTSLRTKGYNTLASTNSNQKVTATVIDFAPGYDADAAVMAGLLGLPPTAVKPMPPTAQLPVPALNGANILVVAGPELAATSTTSTTRSSTSTTGHTSST